MIHICKSTDNQFYVISIGDNGEPLNNGSETFTQKKNCWVNIAAEAKNWNGDRFKVQDDTPKKSVIYICFFSDGKLIKAKRPDFNLQTKHSK